MKFVLSVLGLLFFALSCKTPPQSPSVFAKAKTFQLAKPLIKIDSVLFKKSATISIEMNHPGTEIFFAVKNFSAAASLGEDTTPIEITDRKKIIADAHHPDFLKSEMASAEAVKVNSIAEKAKVSLVTAPHESYPGNGAASLHDLKKADRQFRDKNWLGFRGDTIQIEVDFEKAKAISSVGLSFLEDHKSWIFLPEGIQVLIGEKVVGELALPDSGAERPVDFRFVTIGFPTETTEKIVIKILNLKGIPEWHPGKKLPSWLFVDEVFLE